MPFKESPKSQLTQEQSEPGKKPGAMPKDNPLLTK